MSQDRTAGSKPRGWTVYFILLALGLLIGKGFELVLDKDSMASLTAAQTALCRSVAAVSPFTLSDNFIAKISGYRTGLATISGAGECDEVLGEAVWPFGKDTAERPDEAHYMPGSSIQFILMPLVAAYETAAEAIDQPSWFGKIVVVLQLLAGFAITWLLLFGTDGRKDPHILAVVIFWPIGTIVFGSLFAFALQILMLAALTVFSFFTSLAAGAAGASGILGFGYWIFGRMAERRVEEAVSGLIDPRR